MAQGIQALVALVVLSAAMGLALILFAGRAVSSLQDIRGSTKPFPVAAVRTVAGLFLVAAVAGILAFVVL